ncbi:MAG: hypothetical protein JO023_20535 [Chloroflexi bacterium]|nr:hypothetical protein [Chloroflexota bacterium]
MPAPRGSAWCSLRLRFSAEELVLLRSCEQLGGFVLAERARPDTLRDALALARVGKRLASAQPAELLSLSERDTRLLENAIAASIAEIQWFGTDGVDTTAPHRAERTRRAFPELAEQPWRAFAVGRALRALQQRLSSPLEG